MKKQVPESGAWGTRIKTVFEKCFQGLCFSKPVTTNNHCHQTVIRPAILSLPPEKSPGFMN